MAQDDDLHLRTWRALLRSHARIMRALDATLRAGTGLSIRGYEVLVRLSRAREGPMRMSDLAVSALLSPSGISRLVDRLVERGYVCRIPDPSDKRGFFAELTPEGQAALRKANRVYARGVKEHFADHLTREQLLGIAEALESILGAPPITGGSSSSRPAR